MSLNGKALQFEEVCSFIAGIIYKLTAFLLMVLLIVQGFLYSDEWHTYFNSVYRMEDQYLTDISSNSIQYKIIQITGSSSPSQNIVLLKNGIPVGMVEKDQKIVVKLFEGDVLEIDARGADRPNTIQIRSLYGDHTDSAWDRTLFIGKKLYRFQPFSSKNPCT